MKKRIVGTLLAFTLLLTSVVPAQASSLFSDDDYVTLDELQESTENGEKEDDSGGTNSKKREIKKEDTSDIDTSKIRKQEEVEEEEVEEEEETIAKSANNKKSGFDKDVKINQMKNILEDDENFNVVGQYTVNYTGNVNFIDDSRDTSSSDRDMHVYTLKNDDQFKNVYNNLDLDHVTSGTSADVDRENGSAAEYKKTAGATEIVKAYLVWQTSVQGREGKVVDQNKIAYSVGELEAAKTAMNTPVYLSISPKGYTSVGKNKYKLVTPKGKFIDNRQVHNGQGYCLGNYGETIWYPDENGDPDYSRPPRGNLPVKGTAAVLKSYTMSCMYADVTSYVINRAEADGGSIDDFKVAVMGIPYAEAYDMPGDQDELAWDPSTGSHRGESVASWQLIVIEKNPTVKARAVSLNVGSVFDHTWIMNPSTGKKNLHPISLESTLSLGGFKSGVSGTNINGQAMYVGISSEPSSPMYYVMTGSASKGTAFDADIGQTGLKVDGTVASNGSSGVTYPSSVTGSILNFKRHNDAIGGQPKFDISVTPKNGSIWSTMCVLGTTVDVADYDIDQKQKTQMANGGCDVTGSLKVVTKQNATGYNSGKLVVNIDKNLKVDTASFTVTSKSDNNSTMYTLGTNSEVSYNASKNTVTLAPTIKHDIKNVGDGSTIKYSITCSVKEDVTDDAWEKDSSGNEIVKNSHKLTGKLTVNNNDTELAKTHPKVNSQEKIGDLFTGDTGSFTLKIVPDSTVKEVDNQSSSVTVNVKTDKKGMSRTKARIWLSGDNKHGITLLKGNQAVDSLEVDLKHAASSTDSSHEGNENCILPDIGIRFTRPAYLYVKGKGAVSNNLSTVRFNSREYSWQNYDEEENTRYAETAVNKGTSRQEATQDFKLQLHLANAGIETNANPSPKNAAYTITLSRAQLTLKYDGHGGSGSVRSQTFGYYAGNAPAGYGEQQIKGNGFTRTDYIFDFWNGKRDGGGKQYNPGDAYTAARLKGIVENDPGEVKPTKTIYAQWHAVAKWTIYYLRGNYADFFNAGAGAWKGNANNNSGCGTGGHYANASLPWYLQDIVVTQDAHGNDVQTPTEFVAVKKLKTTGSGVKSHKTGSGKTAVNWTCYTKFGNPAKKTTTVKENDTSLNLIDVGSCLTVDPNYEVTGSWRVNDINSAYKVSYDTLQGEDFSNAISVFRTLAPNGGDIYLYPDTKPKPLNVTYDYGTNGGYQAGTGLAAETRYNVEIGKELIGLTANGEKNGDTGIYSGVNPDGWQFVGWNTDPNATYGLPSLVAATTMRGHAGHVDGDICVTLYAIYKKTVTATFVSHEYYGTDEANVPASSRRDTKIVGDVYNNATNMAFTYPNAYGIAAWTFDGWVPEDVSRASYASGVYARAVVTTKGTAGATSCDYVWYAQYHKDISWYFIQQNGVVRQHDIIYRNSYDINRYGATVTATPPKQILKNGWIAIGWTTDADCHAPSQVNSAGQLSSVSEGAVYYGLYQKDIKISYDPNGYEPVTAMPETQVAKAYFSTSSWDLDLSTSYEHPSYRYVLSNSWLNKFFRDGTGYSKPVDLRKDTDRGFDYPTVTVANTVPVYRKINQRETDVVPTIWSTQKQAPSNDTVATTGEWPELFYRRINCNPEGVYEFREDTLLYQQYKTVTMPDDKMIHHNVSILAGDSINVGSVFKTDYFSDLGRVYVSPDHSIATVEENGKITGRSPGVVVVKVYVSDGKTQIGDCTVTVSSSSVKIPKVIAPGQEAEVSITAISAGKDSVRATLSMDAVSALKGRKTSSVYTLHSYFKDGSSYKEVQSGSTVLNALSSNGKKATSTKKFYVMPEVSLQSLDNDVYDATIVWRLHLSLE